MSKKKEPVADPPKGETPPEAKTEETPKEAKDKAAEVLAELRRKSSEVVLRQTFALAGPQTPDSLVKLLNEACGLDGWCQCIRKKSDTWFCELMVYTRESSDVITTRRTASRRGTGSTPDLAFLAAARMLGIGLATAAKGEATKNTPASPATPPASSNGPAKPTDADVKKQRKAKIEELKKFWSIKLTECSTPDDLNVMLAGSEIKAVPEYAKRDLFEHIRSEAKTIGWDYNKDTRSFELVAEDEPVGEAIPF